MLSKPPLSGRIIIRYTSVNWIDCFIKSEIIFASVWLHGISGWAGKLTRYRWSPMRISMRMPKIPLDEVSGAISTIISSDANKFVFFASIKIQAHNIDFA